MDSLSDIISNTRPDIIVVNELKTKNSGKVYTFFKERGFDPFIKPDGGIAIASLEKFQMVNVSSSNPCILAGLIPGLNLRVIAAYGPQEKESKEARNCDPSLYGWQDGVRRSYG